MPSASTVARSSASDEKASSAVIGTHTPELAPDITAGKLVPSLNSTSKRVACVESSSPTRYAFEGRVNATCATDAASAPPTANASAASWPCHATATDAVPSAPAPVSLPDCRAPAATVHDAAAAPLPAAAQSPEPPGTVSMALSDSVTAKWLLRALV